MKNKILLTILIFAFLLSVQITTAETDNLLTSEENTQIENVLEDNSVQDISAIDEVDVTESEVNENLNSAALPYKKPISKRKLVKKFLLAMFAVGMSSVALYVGLTIYNKIRSGMPVQVKTPDGETPLSSPIDSDTAVRVFLDKTKWK